MDYGCRIWQWTGGRMEDVVSSILQVCKMPNASMWSVASCRVRQMHLPSSGCDNFKSTQPRILLALWAK